MRRLLPLLLAACAAGGPPAPPPTTGAALYQRGAAAHAAGDTTRAEQYYVASLERGHPSDVVFPALIETCLAGDRFDTALHYARARLLRRPSDAGLRYLVATLHLAAGQGDRARVEAERLTLAQPHRPEGFFLLGVIARDHTSERRTALRAFRRYLDLAPEGAHAAEARWFLQHPTVAAAAPRILRRER